MVLTDLGKPTVANINDSANGALISNSINKYFPELLLVSNWNWSLKYRSDNSPSTTDPIDPSYRYAYQLPGDYGRMFRVLNQVGPSSLGSGNGWTIADTFLLINNKPVKYIYQVNASDFSDGDYSICSQVFLNAVSLYVSSMVCTVITNNVSLKNELTKAYQQKIVDAGRLNRYDEQVVTSPHNDYDRGGIFS